MMGRKKGTGTGTGTGTIDLAELEEGMDDTPDPGPSKPTPPSKPKPSNPPPNISGDEAGYNTELYPSGNWSVRNALNTLGYNVRVSNDPIKNHSQAKQFQRDYNEWAQTEFPDYSPLNYGDYDMGKLGVDGTMGEYSLRALEMVYTEGGTKEFNPTRGRVVAAAWEDHFGL
jgi:hypothetical protein